MIQKLEQNLYVFRGAVNNGILVSGNKAILVDCCDSLTPAMLRELGVESVEMILCTQHRRPNVCGVYLFLDGDVDVIAPLAEKHLFDNVKSYWNEPKNRWHIYHHQPSTQILPDSIRVAKVVTEGDVLTWEGFKIQVFDTPGATNGSASYMLSYDGKKYCFLGDLLCGNGQIRDLYSLQKGEDGILDYHGYMGNMKKLILSLDKIRNINSDALIPSHGEIIIEPVKAISLLISRLTSAFSNYSAISSMNYYFPERFHRINNDQRSVSAQCIAPPDFVHHVGDTGFAVISNSGSALAIDCGFKYLVENLQQLISTGIIKSVDSCWVTHYHDDHVDCLGLLKQTFNCPIITTQIVADIVEHPNRYFLPCVSPNSVPVKRVDDRYSWQWHEFTMTAFHFPGQTLYHSGLLVEGYGSKVFFCGDSFSPAGIDDYCAGNRNFLGRRRGFMLCIELLRMIKPDYIINQHQMQAFAFTDDDLDYMEDMLIKRERLMSEILPWDHPDFGTDEWWVRTYPYDQQVEPGIVFSVDIQFTNHSSRSIRALVEPVLPDGWTWDKDRSVFDIVLPGNTSGTTKEGFCETDKCATVWMVAPLNTMKRLYVIPFRITWDSQYLGQFRHALIYCDNSSKPY